MLDRCGHWLHSTIEALKRAVGWARVCVDPEGSDDRPDNYVSLVDRGQGLAVFAVMQRWAPSASG
jgi:hypothetical protein